MGPRPAIGVGRVLLLQALAGLVAGVWPWTAVVVLASATALGGWWAADAHDLRSYRRRCALGVGAVDGLVVAACWLFVAAEDPALAAHSWALRAGLAGLLGTGAGLAGAGLALIGGDARFTPREEPGTTEP